MHIGLLGATGPAGTALAARLASVGHSVTIGSNATAIEAFTAVLLQLNVRYETRVSLQLAGIDDDPHG